MEHAKGIQTTLNDRKSSFKTSKKKIFDAVCVERAPLLWGVSRYVLQDTTTPVSSVRISFAGLSFQGQKLIVATGRGWSDPTKSIIPLSTLGTELPGGILYHPAYHTFRSCPFGYRLPYSIHSALRLSSPKSLRAEEGRCYIP